MSYKKGSCQMLLSSLTVGFFAEGVVAFFGLLHLFAIITVFDFIFKERVNRLKVVWMNKLLNRTVEYMPE